jgi:hypothetical protein
VVLLLKPATEKPLLATERPLAMERPVQALPPQ